MFITHKGHLKGEKFGNNWFKENLDALKQL